MNDYLKKLEEVCSRNTIIAVELNAITKDFLPNLKMVVDQNDFKSFDLLIHFFMKNFNYSIDSIDSSDFHFDRFETSYYLYNDIIIEEKYEFLKAWTEKEYMEVAGSIVLSEAIRIIEELQEYQKFMPINLEEYFKNYFLFYIDLGQYRLTAMLSNKDKRFSSIKETIESYVATELYDLRILADVIFNSKSISRDYLPNRIYTNEMFEYTNRLYNDPGKRLKQDEAILKTLDKFEIPVKKFDSYKVRWGVYRRNPFKK